MLKLRFLDSGEIWELYEGHRLTSDRVKLAVSDMRWFRDICPDHKDVSITVVESDGSVVGFISVSDTFIRYTKVYHDDRMTENERKIAHLLINERSF